MQSHSMPAKLIKTKLKSSYGDQIEMLIEAIWKPKRQKSDTKSLETLPLSINLNTNSGNPAEQQVKMDLNNRLLLPLQLQLAYLLLPLAPVFASSSLLFCWFQHTEISLLQGMTTLVTEADQSS
jgi:hypothetical protein